MKFSSRHQRRNNETHELQAEWSVVPGYELQDPEAPPPADIRNCRKVEPGCVHHLGTQRDKRKDVAEGRKTEPRLNSRRSAPGLSIIAPDILAYASTVCREAGPVMEIDQIEMKLFVEHGLCREAGNGGEFRPIFVIPM
ncbi:MAG: hypothetical protein WBC04_10785 [Candidatus Acidiferrales bacterium]